MLSKLRLRATTVSCLFYFLCSGLIYSQLTSRMPALKEQAGVDPTGIGIALLSLGAGSIVGFISVGIITRYVQSKHILKLSCLLFLLILAGLTLVPNLFMLCACFALAGFAFSWMEVAANTQALNLEIYFKRAYISSMHATFCVGALLGSLIASGFAFSGLPLYVNFLSVVAIIFISFFFCGQKLIADQSNSSPEEEKSAPANQAEPVAGDAASEGQVQIYSRNDERLHGKESSKPRKDSDKIPFFVVFCGFLAMCAYCAEGTVAEWGGLLLTIDKGASEGLAALSYGIFSCFMAIARFCGDPLKQLLGDFKLMFFGTLIGICCELVVITTSNPYVCIGAFAIMGVGLSPVMPLILRRAGRYPGIRPALASTVISTLAYSGMLVLPPSLGYVASHFGLELAFVIPLTCIIIICCGSFAFRLKQKGNSDHDKEKSAQASTSTTPAA